MTIKVEDFGVSAISGDNLYLNAQYNFCKNKKIECTGTLVGFNCFIAIQILEPNEYDQKVDVYSMESIFL